MFLAVLTLALAGAPAWAGHPAGSLGGGAAKPGSGLKFGYVGLEPEGQVEPSDLRAFTERVVPEVYAKARVDKLRLLALIPGLAFVCLAFSRRSRLAAVLRERVDFYAVGTAVGLLLFGVVMGSGFVVAFSYNPSPWQAYVSVEGLASSPLLAFARNLHNWSSEVVLLLLLVHMAKVVSTGGYLGTRKVVWLTGAGLLITTWGTFVVGSFLRADQESVEGFQHIMYAIGRLPYGSGVAGFFTGELALTRLLVVHVSLAALLLTWLTAPHVLMRREYAHIQKRWKVALAYAGILLALLVAQSLTMEAPLIRGLEAGPAVAGVEITKPPWPLYFIVAWENVFGASTMMAAPILVFGPLVLFPYAVDALRLSAASKAKVGEILFYTACLALIAVSYWAASGRIMAHIF